jgi:hypothetical protein
MQPSTAFSASALYITVGESISAAAAFARPRFDGVFAGGFSDAGMIMAFLKSGEPILEQRNGFGKS